MGLPDMQPSEFAALRKYRGVSQERFTSQAGEHLAEWNQACANFYKARFQTYEQLVWLFDTCVEWEQISPEFDPMVMEFPNWWLPPSEITSLLIAKSCHYWEHPRFWSELPGVFKGILAGIDPELALEQMQAIADWLLDTMPENHVEGGTVTARILELIAEGDFFGACYLQDDLTVRLEPLVCEWPRSYRYYEKQGLNTTAQYAKQCFEEAWDWAAAKIWLEEREGIG